MKLTDIANAKFKNTIAAGAISLALVGLTYYRAPHTIEEIKVEKGGQYEATCRESFNQDLHNLEKEYQIKIDQSLSKNVLEACRDKEVAHTQFRERFDRSLFAVGALTALVMTSMAFYKDSQQEQSSPKDIANENSLML